MATIDPNYAPMARCQIQPVKATFTDAADSTYLGLKIYRDDMLTHAIFHYALMDEAGNIYKADNYVIDGQNYTEWAGDNIFPFTFLGAVLGLTFVD